MGQRHPSGTAQERAVRISLGAPAPTGSFHLNLSSSLLHIVFNFIGGFILLPSIRKQRLSYLLHQMAGRLTSGVAVGGQFFKYDCEEIDLRLTAKGLTEDDLRELGDGLRAGKFHRLRRLNLVGVCFVRPWFY